MDTAADQQRSTTVASEIPEALAVAAQTACVMSEPDDLGRTATIAILWALRDQLENPRGGSNMISGRDAERWASELEADRLADA
jgi:hypothetical protein